MISKNDPLLLAYRKERNAKKKRALADRLVRENMNLVHRLVGKFTRWAPEGVEVEDLTQAALIAFLYTIDNIDVTKTFSTYFAYRVWYEISKCCEKAGLIYRPRGTGMPYKVLKQIEQFMTVHGRAPTAEELGVSQEKMDAWALLPTTISLDQQIAEGSTLHEAVPDSKPLPDAEAVDDEEHTSVREAVLALPEGQRRVMECLYYQGKSVAATSTLLKMPVSWVESTRDAAMEKLRGELG